MKNNYKELAVFESERCYFTRFQLADAAAFYEMNLNEEVLRYTGDAPFVNVQEAERFIQQYDHYQQYGFGRWTVRLKADDRYLGFCGLKYHKDADFVDLGYRIVRQEWGKGYATEVAKASLVFAFNELQLNGVVGRVMKENIASVRVLEKIGMHFVREFDFDGYIGLLYNIDRKSNPWQDKLQIQY